MTAQELFEGNNHIRATIMPEGAKVQEMFASIAEQYDCTNRLVSFGIDLSWRRKIVRMVADQNPRSALDLATGSGDLAIALSKALAPETNVIGMDFCNNMLEIAARKQKSNCPEINLKFQFGDCLEIPLEDNSVDAITIAFGLRNLESRHKGLQEMHRVLDAERGQLFILEFTQPHFLFRPFYYLYLKNIPPIIGGITSGKASAYRYLASSIESFPDRSGLADEIKAAGFSEVSHIGLTFSTVAIHQATV